MGKKYDTENKAVENKLVDGGDKAAADGGRTPEKNLTAVVLKMDLHCEGCAKKVKRSISRFEGVEKVEAEFDAKKLTVIGNVDPSVIIEKIEQKTKKKVELISPNPQKANDEEKSEKSKANDHKVADDKRPKELAAVSTVVAKMRLHCAECAAKIKRTLLKNVDGVNSVTTDLVKDLIMVDGTMDPNDLTAYLREKLKRNVQIVPMTKNDEEDEERHGGSDTKERQVKDDRNSSKSKSKEKNGEEGIIHQKNKNNIVEETKVELVNKNMEHVSSLNPQTSYYDAAPLHYQDNYYYGNHDYYHNNNQAYYPNNPGYVAHYGPPLPPPTYLNNMNDSLFSDENPNGCVLM